MQIDVEDKDEEDGRDHVGYPWLNGSKNRNQRQPRMFRRQTQ